MKNLSQARLDASSWTLPRIAFWLAVFVLLGAGCYLRLAGLGTMSMVSDGQFHDVCRTQAVVVDILTHWEQLVGGNTGQMPGSVAFTRLVLDVFGLPPTLANVVFPSALWGILAMLAAFGVGWRFGGRAYALLLLSVVALGPMYIQMSRMAYFYPPCVVGAFLGIWCVLESWERTRAKLSLSWTFHGIHAVATLLLLYSSANAWPLAAMMAAFHLGCAIMRAARKGLGWRDVMLLVAAYLVIGIPLLTASWGVRALLAVTDNNELAAYGRKIMEVGRSVPVAKSVVWDFLLKLGWGWTWQRGMFTGAIVASGLVTTIVMSRRKKHWLFPFVILAGGLTFSLLALISATWEFGVRRVASNWPAYSMLLALGLWGLWKVGAARLPHGWKWVGLVPVAVALGLWTQADLLVLKVNGAPAPYRWVSDWLDRTFPKGTPVVTDRFFTAMCEFNRSHPTTNVVVISTVPNELPEIQEKTQFREVTRRYLEDNPDAVFYCDNHLYGRPGVTRWDWPLRYFKHRKEFLDGAAWTLASMGQNYFLNQYHLALRLPCTVYYNTIDDVMASKRREGVMAFVTYGADWRPVQTQDYRLWRMMTNDKASIVVYNVTSNLLHGTVAITGVSVGGRSKLEVAAANVDFPPNQLLKQQVKVDLKPGANSFCLRRSGSEQGRLLIGRIEIEKHE